MSKTNILMSNYLHEKGHKIQCRMHGGAREDYLSPLKECSFIEAASI
jgi:hypothetical protein